MSREKIVQYGLGFLWGSLLVCKGRWDSSNLPPGPPQRGMNMLVFKKKGYDVSFVRRKVSGVARSSSVVYVTLDEGSKTHEVELNESDIEELRTWLNSID